MRKVVTRRKLFLTKLLEQQRTSSKELKRTREMLRSSRTRYDFMPYVGRVEFHRSEKVSLSYRTNPRHQRIDRRAVEGDRTIRIDIREPSRASFLLFFFSSSLIFPPQPHTLTTSCLKEKVRSSRHTHTHTHLHPSTPPLSCSILFPLSLSLFSPLRKTGLTSTPYLEA